MSYDIAVDLRHRYAHRMTEEVWVEAFANHVRSLRSAMTLQGAQAIGLQQWDRYHNLRTPEKAALEWDKETRPTLGTSPLPE